MWRSLELGVGALAFDLDCGRFEGCANGGTGACASPIPSRLTIISLCAGDTKIDEAVLLMSGTPRRANQRSSERGRAMKSALVMSVEKE